MTIDEAKIFIQNAMEQSRNVLAELMLIMPKVFMDRKSTLGEYYSNLENCKKEIQACEIAVKALEEVQQYRALEKRLSDMFCSSTSLKIVVDELERNLKEPGSPHPMKARILTYKESADWDEYRTIGTPEECRTAMEKQHADKPLHQGYVYVCPSCNSQVTMGSKFIRPGTKFCEDCGQKLDWSDVE